MHLLLIGGTVFVGRHIVEAALAAGHRVTLFHRGRSGAGLFPHAETLLGDRDTPEGIAMLQGRRFDAVIDTCGYRPKQMTSMAAALADIPVKTPYLFVSSISVYRRFAPHAPYDEDNERAAGDEGYGPLKARCEDAITAAWRGPVCIVRPGLIVGPHDPTGRFTHWPDRIARGGEVLAPGRPQRPVQWIDVRDLAVWCVRLVQAPRAGVFNAVRPNHPMSELLQACCDVAESDARLHWVPDAELLAAGFAPWTELPLWLPEDDAEHGGMLRADSTRATRAKLVCRPIKDTVRDVLGWLRSERAQGREPSASIATLDVGREAAWLRSRAAPA